LQTLPQNDQDHTKELLEVAIPLPVHRVFTYRVPQELRISVGVGKRVLVPFGRRRLTGYVTGFASHPPKVAQIKGILDVLDDEPLFPKTMVPFFQWVANYYLHPLGEVIQTALPGGLTVAECSLFQLSDSGRRVMDNDDVEDTVRQLFKTMDDAPCNFKTLSNACRGALSRSKLSGWVAKGWVVQQTALKGERTRPKTQRFVKAIFFDRANTRVSPQRETLLAALETKGALSVQELKTLVPTAANLVRAMARDHQVRIEERTVYRDPLGAPIASDQPPDLTAEQITAVNKIGSGLGKGFKTFLLSGVTGSGKTEVYLHLAAETLKKRMAVLVLVPEIALISQIERAFRARFGDKIALLHSGLSNGERYDQWLRIARGDIRIAIGARSAIFAPFDCIGLIIVDEEHDDSYKQEGALRYNARDLAVVRSQMSQCVAVVGSATPSIQSAYNVQIGKYEKVSLHERIDNRCLPDIVVQDLTQLKEEQGLRRFFTPQLIEAMQACLSRDEQVLLFLNRRGFANILVCAGCGEPVRCDRCDISLTFHQYSNAYKCHYCGFSRTATSNCNQCGSPQIKRLGLGTEKVESKVQSLFPQARVARMDRDTTRRKGAIVRILKSLKERQIDILVGTQMVAKGHDYPHITLVGIICADLSLSMPDFRAGERTFQLLAQVAGRAGRGTAPGQVILQTYNPRHFSIQAARNQDYEAFYRQEIEFRKALDYPPFSRIIQVRFQGKDKTRTAGRVKELGRRCRQLQSSHPDFREIELLGPIEAPLARIANQYRWQLLIKSPKVKPLHKFMRGLLYEENAMSKQQDINVAVDVDPLFLM
jgi:primosomal protein N' (replication factor Y) (superfamily II helicase)